MEYDMHKTPNSSVEKEAEIHDTLGTHSVSQERLSLGENDLNVCTSCHHILIYRNGGWKSINTKEVSSFSDFKWLRGYPRLSRLIRVYERRKYLYCPSFALYMARDVIGKPTKTSRAVARLDEIYGFHYANDVEGRTTPEAAAEFHRIMRKRLNRSP